MSFSAFNILDTNFGTEEYFNRFVPLDNHSLAKDLLVRAPSTSVTPFELLSLLVSCPHHA